MVKSESVVGIKPGDSHVMIGYQVDNFLPPGQQSTPLLDHAFILVQVKCPHQPTSHLNQVVRIYFLDQMFEDLEHGLVSVLTDSVNTVELDASFDETDGIPSSVSSGFLGLG